MLQTLTETSLHEQILSDLPDALLYTRPVLNDNGLIIDFEIIFSNKKANDIINHPEGKLTGLWIYRDGIPTKELGFQSYQHFLKIYHSGESDGFSFVVKDISVYALRRKLGDGVLSIFRHRALQEEVIYKLQDQANLLNGIIQQSPSGLICAEAVRDGQGSILDFNTILANKTGADLLEFELGELYQLSLGQVCQIRHAYGIIDQFLKVVETGTPLYHEYYLESVRRWFSLSAVKINDGFLVVFTDITENKRLQTQLEQSVYELKHSNEYLNEFAHAASHDLKEPVRKVHFFANRLKTQLSERLEPEEIRLFERMENATGRMQNLIDDLLEYSQVSHRFNRFENVPLTVKLKDVLSDLDVLIHEKGARIEIDELPVVKGSGRQLQQLFQNLISNALKYHKPGLAPEISIRHRMINSMDIPGAGEVSTDHHSYHLVEITDKGIGFDQQYAKRIFDIFQRLHGNSEYKGSGIGLAIARKVVENHNGHIWASSQPGEGACFFVALPVK